MLLLSMSPALLSMGDNDVGLLRVVNCTAF